MFEKFLNYSFYSSNNNQNKKRNELTSVSINNSKIILLKMMQEIESIYEKAQNSIKHSLDSIQQTDARKWHERYIDDRKRQFAALDRVDLSRPIYNKMYDNTIINWIHGFYGVEKCKDESLWDYSLRVEDKSWQYKSQIEEYKNTWEDNNSNIIKSNAIRAIKKYIETCNLREKSWINKIKDMDGYRYPVTIAG